MKKKGKSCDWQGKSLCKLRLVLGLIFLVAGWSKLTGGPAGLAGGLEGAGWIFLPLVFAWAVMLVELIGGAFLILGIWARWSAIPLMLVMLVAMVLKWLGNFGSAGFLAGWSAWRWDLLALVALGVVFAHGPGSWALERVWKKR